MDGETRQVILFLKQKLKFFAPMKMKKKLLTPYKKLQVLVKKEMGWCLPIILIN
jgi:hypothetical protein